MKFNPVTARELIASDGKNDVHRAIDERYQSPVGRVAPAWDCRRIPVAAVVDKAVLADLFPVERRYGGAGDPS